MLIEREKLLLPRPSSLEINTVYWKTDDGGIKCEVHEFIVDWAYYFKVLDDPSRNSQERQLEISDMLIEAKVLCLRRTEPQSFGVLVDGMLPILGYLIGLPYFFTTLEYAKGYLDAAIRAKRAKQDRDFVFLVL